MNCLMSAFEADAAPLPPPASAFEIEQLGDVRLFLELVVNEKASGKIVPVTQRGGHFLVDADDLRAVDLPLPDEQADEVEIDTLPGVVATYDESAQRLLLTVPPAWLPMQQIGKADRFERAPALTSTGAVLNYDVYTTVPTHGGTRTAAWTELRMFGELGALRTTGVYQHATGGHGAGPDAANRYIRYDTGWRYADEDRMLTYEAGDLVSGALGWTSPVRLGGVQVARNFAVRPDVVTYPLPQFAGSAAVPTAVDLFVNGYKSSSAHVDPGPFTLTNVPFVNGAGEAVVVTTDALGRQVSTTVPFYVSSSLLRPGLYDFAVAAGFLRRDYGLDNFSYGPGAASATMRYGITDYLTAEAHAEASAGLAVGGLGGVAQLGYYGTLNAAVSQSRAAGRSGTQVVAGYQYSNRNFSAGAQHVRRNADFNDLAGHGIQLYLTSREATQANASVALGDWGSIGAGYFDLRAADRSRTRLVNLSWSKPLWGNSSVMVSANRDLDSGKWSGALQLVVPVGRQGTASASVDRTGDTTTGRVQYNRSIPSDGGFGWNVGYAGADRGSSYQQGSIAWRGDRIRVQAGVFGSGSAYTGWGDLSGALLWMGNAVFAANRVADAFVLVDTGVPDVPVRFENQRVGKTDADGHLLVPWTTPYYNAKYEIDTLGLGVGMEAREVEKRVAVKAGSGYVLPFPVRQVRAATLVLHDAAGKPLPVGAVATTDGGQTAYVGWDGLVYLEHLAPRNAVTVDLPGGGRCGTSFALPSSPGQIPRIGPLTCR